jgi:hypothetical protein
MKKQFPVPKVECVTSPVHHSTGTDGGSSTSLIVLDLNRNGVTSISLAASIALFDYDGDGVKENTAWIENTDALLVNDVNNDSIINDATELFGNYTCFEELKLSVNSIIKFKTQKKAA